MQYTTNKEVEETGIDMEEFKDFILGQTGGVLPSGEFVYWTHDVNRLLRHKGLEELEGQDYHLTI